MRTSLKAEVLPLFSSPVYVCEDTTMPNIISDIEGMDYNHRPMQGGQTVSMNVLDKLPEFKNWLMYHIEEYAYGVMGVDNTCHSLHITCSWINKHKHLDKSHDHSHRNSMFSGIVYLQTHENCGDLQFLDQSYYMVSPRIRQHNLYNSKQWTITPTDGMVVMFPSSLVHTVQQNRVMRERYSLAYNVFVKGDFGNPTSLLSI